MSQRVFVTTLLCSLLATTQALAYDVNKDLRNVGRVGAHDIMVILSGRETVTQHYDGFSNRRFGSFSTGPYGVNTALDWDNLSEPGGNNIVDPGEIVHVGWSLADHACRIKDMFWTDAQGNRIPGSIIYNITNGWRYETGQRPWATWVNDLVPTISGTPRPTIAISDLRFAVMNGRVPLERLNMENSALNGALQPWPIPGGVITLAPDAQAQLQLPVAVLPGAYVVLRYNIANGGDAISTDFVQSDQMGAPTSAKGAGVGAAAGLLLVAAIASAFRRRRATA